MQQLQERIAVVTGSARGRGQGAALGLANESGMTAGQFLLPDGGGCLL
ncbi:hypothetical protein [Caldimonas tepidiphila]|nr:hypothetical protein [Caldimonas tepidiphila]